jgi:hypothetical protein
LCPDVLTVKVRLLEPADIVIEDGTVATDTLLLLRKTTAPEGGAAPLRVTVPVEEEPPFTGFGDSTSVVSEATVTVKMALRLTPNVPVMVAEVDELTPEVVMIKVAVRFPAATVTLAGTLVAELPAERVTIVPPEGAGPLRVTVPVDEFPPTIDVGLTVNKLSVGGLIVRVA